MHLILTQTSDDPQNPFWFCSHANLNLTACVPAIFDRKSLFHSHFIDNCEPCEMTCLKNILNLHLKFKGKQTASDYVTASNRFVSVAVTMFLKKTLQALFSL